MKVYVFDPLWPSLITPENLKKLKDAEVDIQLVTKQAPLSETKDLFENTEDKILAFNPDAVDWSLPSEKFKDIKNLKAIITQSTSYGWIDTDYASKNGTTVINTRNFSTDAVADWAILMMLNVARRIPLLIKNKFPLNFASDFQTYQGTNLQGKKAGIIGFGNIGSAIADRCEGLGMNVCYWNRSGKDVMFQKNDIASLFEECDVIFPTMADTDDSRKVITDEMLNSMKPDSMLVSIVHKSYNHDLVLKLAEMNKIFGYAFEAAPQSFEKYEGNVWAAPAYAWCTDGSLRKSMDQFVDLISSAVKGTYKNKVN